MMYALNVSRSAMTPRASGDDWPQRAHLTLGASTARGAAVEQDETVDEEDGDQLAHAIVRPLEEQDPGLAALLSARFLGALDASDLSQRSVTTSAATRP